MSTIIIEPTIGRIVHYRGLDGATRAAIVVGVNGAFNLDLYVFGQNSEDATHGHMGHVTHADPEKEPGCIPSWHWMPYQIGQAKKHADESAVAASTACAGQVIGSSGGLYGSLRYEALRAAMGTPGLSGHEEHIEAAKAYEQYLTTH